MVPKKCQVKGWEERMVSKVRYVCLSVVSGVVAITLIGVSIFFLFETVTKIGREIDFRDESGLEV